MKTIQDAIFRRAELLLGDEAMKQIAQKRVIIFGVDSFDIAVTTISSMPSTR